MKEYEFHPLAEIFPLIEGREFEDLVQDIAQHGLIEPIVLYDGKIIDGRNRYLACEDSGIEPVFRTYSGDDPAGYVISLNLKRRHLSESQRAMVAVKLATLEHGGDRKTEEFKTSIEGLKIEKAAELLNVGRASVERAKTVDREGVPELKRAVERGKVSVSAAADIATQPKERQAEIASWSEKDILSAAKDIRTERAKVKHKQRLDKIVELTEAEGSLPDDMLFPVLYADPPWRFEPYSRTTGMDRAADNHYPTMTVDMIMQLEPPCLDDAVLFLWATAPMLPQALDVMAAWGFAYKSQIIWGKDRIGTGYWARNKHELLLIGSRGSIPAPLPGTQPDSLVMAAVSEHSRKPEAFRDIIEKMFPGIPKLEMFSRSTREGWHAWGKEVGKYDQVAA
jgi:N6-adenosine-specific RNA methylase IME4/ParB-like chromosome segregation protein Spo0J